MASLITALFLSTFSWTAHAESEARVILISQMDLPAEDQPLIDRLADCGITGQLLLLRDPLREHATGVYFWIKDIKPNVFCRSDAFLFMRDRAYKKKLQLAFEEGTPILLSMHESPLGHGAVALRGEPVVKELRRATGFADLKADYLLLGRWASFYDFTILDKQISDAAWLLDEATRLLVESQTHLNAAMYNRIMDFIEDARATDSAIIEIENGQQRIEYFPDESHRANVVEDAAAYREKYKSTLLVHIKDQAMALMTSLKQLAASQPKSFRGAVAAIHQLVPMRTLKRLSINSDLDLNVSDACAQALTASIVSVFPQVSVEPDHAAQP